LLGAQPEALAREPLLGDAELWHEWFAAAGLRTAVRPVAVFNDAGLMLQAAEQDLGITLTREILAADALIDGRLVRLSPIAITHREAQPYNIAPPGMEAWAALVSFRRWRHDEVRDCWRRPAGFAGRAGHGHAPARAVRILRQYRGGFRAILGTTPR
jgi:LysR family glycine cleavage system transcriptional activator